MARGNPHGYNTLKAYKPATQNFEGQAAGGRGSSGGLLNDGKDHRQAPDLQGSFGPFVANGEASGEAKRLISKSTGVSVEGPVPQSAFPSAKDKY